MLSILAWWAIPVGAVVLAAAVSALARRVRRPSDDDTIHAYRRFREAISNEDPVEAVSDGDPVEAVPDEDPIAAPAEVGPPV